MSLYHSSISWVICYCKLFGFLVTQSVHFRYSRSCLRSNKVKSEMSKHGRNTVNISSKLEEGWTKHGKHDRKRRYLFKNLLWTWMEQKSLMITKFPNTISSGKIIYPYLFFSYPFLPGHLSLCTDTHFHKWGPSRDPSCWVAEIEHLQSVFGGVIIVFVENKRRIGIPRHSKIRGKKLYFGM